MSGLIPQPFIDDLLHRTDLVELIDSYIPLRKRGNSFTACCPFHNEKSPSFNVVAKKQFYHCFGCGASGNAVGFVMNYLNQGFVEAIETLAARAGLTVPREGQSEKSKTAADLYTILAKITVYYQKELKHHGQSAVHYLQNRGVNGNVAKLYQLGYAQEGWQRLEKEFAIYKQELIAGGVLIKNDEGRVYARFQHRVIFPIHDRHGRVIGFGGRALSDTQKPKYLNSPETVIFQKSRELYGLHQVLSGVNSPEFIIVVEGYMDVIALAQYDVFNAVATLGTATSTYHIQLLAKHTTRIIFCFDGDLAGKNAAWRALESSLPHLNGGLDAHFIFLPEGQDPDSLIRKEGKAHFLKYLKDAIPLHHFFFKTLAKDIDLSSLAGKTQLLNKAKPYLQKMEEGSYKQLLIEDLARQTHLDSDRLNRLLADPDDINTHEPSAAITRTPLRTAVALLLQNPEIYDPCAPYINALLLHPQEHHILLTLLDKLSKNPKATTASLTETWRDTKYFLSINKLASWNHQVPQESLTEEFIDTLKFLQEQNRELAIQYYINKAKQEGLSEGEKFNLQHLLKLKHMPASIEK